MKTTLSKTSEMKNNKNTVANMIQSYVNNCFYHNAASLLCLITRQPNSINRFAKVHTVY